MMMRAVRRWSGAMVAMAAMLVPAMARAQAKGAVPGGDAMARMAVETDRQMDDPFGQPDHIALSPLRPYTPADSARGAEVLTRLRAALEKYKDVASAKRDGFQLFAPDVPGQHIYHFNNYAWAMANETSFDPTKPTSLLYSRTKDGGWKLEGAMYTAPAEASLDDLDRRVPLSVGRWHRHINFCFPPSGGRSKWETVTRNGKPVFGPMGVSTREACEAAGGRFVPQVFGWMVHAMPFGTDDPRVAFGGMEGMHGHH